MSFRKDQILKYNGYENLNHAIFIVTLSAFVESEKVARIHMRTLWDNHFIPKVTERLPWKLKEKIDHDFVIECSPGGHYHFHGLFAVPAEAAHRIFPSGFLHPQLKRDLDSFKNLGQSRPCRINKYEIKPAIRGDVAKWIQYITKSATTIIPNYQ